MNEEAAGGARRVRIVQLLCPQRHCVIASAYESDDGEEIPAVSLRLSIAVAAMIANCEMNPRCGLCHSDKLHFEDGVTAYSTIEEAMPALRENERRMAATREFFRAGRN